MRLLFVTPYPPSPPMFGGQRRMHGLISALAAEHDISVLSFVDAREDPSQAIRAMEEYSRRVLTVENRRFTAIGAEKRLLQARSLLSPWSYGWLVHRHWALARQLERMLESGIYDIVQFEFAHMASYGVDIKRRKRPLFVLDEHNIEHELVRQTAAADTGAMRRAFAAVDWRKVQTEERRAWTRLDGCALTSERDRERLLVESPTTRTVVVPNGVDLEFFQPRPGAPAREPATVLFFGAIDYYPNTDGLLYYFHDILPQLRAKRRDIRTLVVGRRPPEAIAAKRSPSVEITGEVADLRPYLELATVVIVPLRIGSGTRLKILEAMAMGKAVVSTALGAEGLDVVSGRDILIADTPGAFAREILRLVDDPGLALRIGRAARRTVQARYGWQASVGRLVEFYAELLRARSST